MDIIGRVLTKDELRKAGFKRLGHNVRISSKASFHNIAQISIGDNVRIDDFTVITAGKPVVIGSYIHIASHVYIGGTYGFEMEDFSTFANGCRIYSICDDYSGESMTNPMVPMELRKGYTGKVHIGRHVIIGANTVILPKIMINDGVSVGACSLVKQDCEAWGIYAGVPAQKIGDRKKRALNIRK
jgi:dTDP-4-amino-4,6-dideoxy-D-glucose acyltransferase